MRELLAERRPASQLKPRWRIDQLRAVFARRSRFFRINLTAAIPALAMLINQWFRPQLEGSFEPAFIAAVAVVCTLCGPGYGIAALALSAALLHSVFLTPQPGALVKLSFFLGANSVIVALIAYFYRVRAEVAASERMYRNLAELIPFGGWISDPAGQMVHISDSFLNTFGVTLSDCAGLGWTKLIDEDQRVAVISEWQQCARNSYFWDYEYRMRSKTGEPLVVLSRGIPVYDEQGRKQAWVGMHLDVTEREHFAEERLRQARDIARFNAELEQLAYVSAHDLQEPLRMIASYLQLLQKRYTKELDQQANEYIEYAVEGANRLRSLLQDLLLLQSVGKSARLRLEHSLTDLVRQAIARLQPMLENARIEVGPLPGLICDGQEFIDLFEHLIGNAVKYSREGVQPEISVTGGVGPQGVTVCVRDNGIGIEGQYIQRIFEVFQRLHPRSKYPGTGIGLAICRKIVEVHGGRIWAESTPGEGSSFCFTIPPS